MTPAPTHYISARLSAVAPSATLAVDAKTKTFKVASRLVIGFGAGKSNFPTPDYITEVTVATAEDPANHRYSPAKGLLVLRKATATKTLYGSDYEVSPDGTLVTNGGRQTVFQAFAALVDPGDETLLLALYWTTCPEAVALAEGTMAEVFAGADRDYKVSVDQLEAAHTEHTRVPLLCSPPNSTSSVYTPKELTVISQWVLEHGIWVIINEIYGHLLYDGAQATHVAQLVPESTEQTIALSGMAEAYAITGWYVGWVITLNDIIKAAANFQSYLTSNITNVSQRTALVVVNGDLTAIEQVRTAFDRRRRTMVGILSQIKRLTVPVPRGTFHVYPNIEGLVGCMLRGITIDSSTTLAVLVLEHAEVTTVPSEASDLPDFVRLSYALGDDNLVEGVGRVQKLLTEVG